MKIGYEKIIMKINYEVNSINSQIIEFDYSLIRRSNLAICQIAK